MGEALVTQQMVMRTSFNEPQKLSFKDLLCFSFFFFLRNFDLFFFPVWLFVPFIDVNLNLLFWRFKCTFKYAINPLKSSKNCSAFFHQAHLEKVQLSQERKILVSFHSPSIPVCCSHERQTWTTTEDERVNLILRSWIYIHPGSVPSCVVCGFTCSAGMWHYNSYPDARWQNCDGVWESEDAQASQ